MNGPADGSRRWLPPAALAALVLLVFWPARNFPFVGFDDAGHLFANPYLQPASVKNALGFWVEPRNNIYMPLVFTLWSALAMAVQHGGASSLRDAAWMFHRANIAVHTLNVLLVYSILLALLERTKNAPPRRARWAAFAGALLFAWHPLQVEPVAWASGMKDLLCGFFALTALRAYLAYFFGGAKSKPLYCAALAAYGLALLAKPTAAALPFIKLALDLWMLRRPPRLALRWALEWLVMAIPFVILNGIVQPTSHLDTLAPWWARPLIAADSLSFHLYHLLFPFRLGLDYGRTPQLILSSGWTCVLWIFPIGLAACLLRRAESGVYGAASAVFAAWILPDCGLVSFQHQLFSTVADRYAYLSILGAGLALAHWLNARTGPRKNVAAGAAAVLLLLLGARARAQLGFWKDTETMYRHALDVNPGSIIFNDGMGSLLWRAKRLKEAESHYQAALKTLPTYGLSRNHLGDLYLAQGRIPDARDQYIRTLNSLNSADVAYARVRLGVAALLLGKRDEAMRQNLEALKADPKCAAALNAIGDIYAREGAGQQAAQFHRLALDANPFKEKTLDTWPAKSDSPFS